MAQFTFDKNKFLDIVDTALLTGTELLLRKSKEATPRDKKRLPNPIVLKKKKAPERNVRKGNKHRYSHPVRIGSNWYEWVSWDLQRSIDMEQIGRAEYVVWVRSGHTVEYAKAHEFWSTRKNIPKRSFLRDPAQKHKKSIEKQIQITLSELLNRS